MSKSVSFPCIFIFDEHRRTILFKWPWIWEIPHRSEVLRFSIVLSSPDKHHLRSGSSFSRWHLHSQLRQNRRRIVAFTYSAHVRTVIPICPDMLVKSELKSVKGIVWNYNQSSSSNEASMARTKNYFGIWSNFKFKVLLIAFCHWYCCRRFISRAQAKPQRRHIYYHCVIATDGYVQVNSKSNITA